MAAREARLTELRSVNNTTVTKSERRKHARSICKQKGTATELQAILVRNLHSITCNPNRTRSKAHSRNASESLRKDQPKKDERSFSAVSSPLIPIARRSPPFHMINDLLRYSRHPLYPGHRRRGRGGGSIPGTLAAKGGRPAPAISGAGSPFGPSTIPAAGCSPGRPGRPVGHTVRHSYSMDR